MELLWIIPLASWVGFMVGVFYAYKNHEKIDEFLDFRPRCEYGSLDCDPTGKYVKDRCIYHYAKP